MKVIESTRDSKTLTQNTATKNTTAQKNNNPADAIKSVGQKLNILKNIPQTTFLNPQNLSLSKSSSSSTTTTVTTTRNTIEIYSNTSISETKFIETISTTKTSSIDGNISSDSETLSNNNKVTINNSNENSDNNNNNNLGLSIGILKSEDIRSKMSNKKQKKVDVEMDADLEKLQIEHILQQVRSKIKINEPKKKFHFKKKKKDKFYSRDRIFLR